MTKPSSKLMKVTCFNTIFFFGGFFAMEIVACYIKMDQQLVCLAPIRDWCEVNLFHEENVYTKSYLPYGYI